MPLWKCALCGFHAVALEELEYHTWKYHRHLPPGGVS